MNAPVTLDIGHGLDGLLFPGAPGVSAHILAFHGGGGVDGAPEIMTGFARRLSGTEGARVAVTRYRTLKRDNADFEDMRADAAHALAWARTALPPQGRLYVLGASFGGLLALDCVLDAPGAVQDAVTGLILLNPVTDTGPDGFANRVISPDCHADLSPLRRMAGHGLLDRLDCFIAHGGGDDVVPIQSARRFAALWPEGRCEMLEFPNSSHGFFNRPAHGGTVADAVRRFVGVPPAPAPADAATAPQEPIAPSRPTPSYKPTSSYKLTPAPAQRGPRPRLLPDGATMLYGVGAQKAGTSWLYDCLQHSPDCHTVPTKELHYFDALYALSEATHLENRLDQLRRVVASLTEGCDPDNLVRLRRARLLADRLSIHATTPGDHRPYVEHMLTGYGGQKYICDFTPSYGVLDKNGFAQMASIGPARFIFVLRDPVARMWSQIRMAMAVAHPGLPDAAFEAKCAAHARDLYALRDLARIPRADYARTTAALEAATARDRIHYAFYEDLFSQDSVDRICAFLGIDPVPASTDRKVNAGRSGAMPDDIAAMLTRGLMPQYTAALDRFGDAVPPAWRARIDIAAPAAPAAGLPRAVARNTRRAVRLFRRKTPEPATPTPTIAFLHIPKTAGQTVIRELARAFPQEALCPVRTHSDAPADAQMPPGYRLYAGHIDWIDLDMLPADRFAFTVLRDPRERIASFYFYLLREAAKLAPEDLQSKARTNMRMISTRSADDYFFGGDAAWQRFVRDHYDNFYCSYLITRKVRGWKQVRALDRETLVARALDGAGALQGVYATNDLEALEQDMERLLGTRPGLLDTYVNAGPDAAHARRWPDLLARFERDDSAERLDAFARADSVLMKRLGLAE